MFKLNTLTYYYKDLSMIYTNFQIEKSKGHILLPFIHKTIYKKSPYIISLKLFNLLPSESKKIDSNKSIILRCKLLKLLLYVNMFSSE